MSTGIEIENYFVDRGSSFLLNLSNVQDISNTTIVYQIDKSYDTSGNPVTTYKDTGEPICILDPSGSVTLYNEGICDIKSFTTETNLYNIGNSTIKRLIISKQKQNALILDNTYNYSLSSTTKNTTGKDIYFLDTVAFNIRPGTDITQATLNSNNAPQSSNSPYILNYTCTPAASCKVVNNKITFNLAGPYTITASNPGNYMYYPTSITFTVNVEKLKQTNLQISILGAIADNSANQSYALPINPTKYYNLQVDNFKERPVISWAVSSSSSTQVGSTVCQITNNQLAVISGGPTCYLYAQLAATQNYSASSTPYIIINPIKQLQDNIIFNPDPLFYNGSITINATGGNSNNPLVYSLSNTNCTISGNTLYGVTPGECILTISKAGNDIYDDLENDFDIVVQKISQSDAYVYLLGAFNVDVSSNSTSSLPTSNTFVNRDISYQVITENTRGNPNSKYKFISRNILYEDTYLYFFYSFNYETTTGLLLKNSAPNITNSYDAFLSISGLISITDNINGNGVLTLDNSINQNQYQYVSLPLFLNGPNGITFSFWIKINNAPNKGLFFSFGNGYHKEELYLGQNNSKLFAGYSRTDNNINIHEVTLNYPFGNFNNGLWHYIIWVIYPNGVWKFYLNGLLLEIIYDIPYPEQIKRTKNYIGYATNKIWTSFSMSNFKLYNRSLVDNEIKYLTDYSSIYTSLNINDFYLNNNLKLQYSFESYTIENSLNFNGISAIPAPLPFNNNNLTITNLQVNTFMNGTYKASASSFYGVGYEPFQAMNIILQNGAPKFWSCAQNLYTLNTGTYIGSSVTNITGVGNIEGEWIQIQLPYVLILKSYSILSQNSVVNGVLSNSMFPSLFFLVGSLDGNIWYIINYQKLTTIPPISTIQEYSVKYNLTIGFSYYRLIIKKLCGGDANSTIINLSNFLISGNYLDQTKTNQYQLASIENNTLNYNGILSRKNIVINDSIIDYCSFNKAQSDYISINSLNLNQFTDISGISFAFWFNSNGSADGAKLFEFYDGSNNLIICEIFNNSIGVHIKNGTTDIIYNNFININVNDSVWRHFIWTISPNQNWTFYINNIQIQITSSKNVNYIYPAFGNYTFNYFGKSNNPNANYYLNGGISDFRIYNRILSTIEMTDLYNFKIPIFFKLNQNNNLIFYYPLDINNVNNSNIAELSTGKQVFNGTISNINCITSNLTQYGFSYADLVLPTDFIKLAPFTTISGNLTFCFWFCLKNLSENQVLFEFSNNGISTISVIINNINDGYYALNLNVTINSMSSSNSPTPCIIWIPINEFRKWYHITWTLSAIDTNYLFASWSIYIDGKLFNVFNSNTNNIYYYPESISRTTNFIGKSYTTKNTTNYVGSISDLRLYNKLLSVNEIKYFSTYKYFPIYKFNNDSITPYNFGGIYIQSYITGTFYYNFTLSKTLYLNIYKSDQPNFKITYGVGDDDIPFDGSSVLNNASPNNSTPGSSIIPQIGIDGYNIDYINTSVNTNLPSNNLLSCFGHGLRIYKVTNDIYNESFIVESDSNGLIYTNGNKVGSRGISGNQIQNIKITKIGDYKTNDLTKIYRVYLKKNNALTFSPIIKHEVSTNILNNINNTYVIRIDRDLTYDLLLTNYNYVNMQYVFVSNGLSTGSQTTTVIINGVTIASIKNNTLLANNYGTVYLMAILPKSDQFNESTSTIITINIQKDYQIPLALNYIPKLLYNSSVTLLIDGGSSSSQIIFSAADTSICSITNNNIINGNKVGSTLITAFKQGDDFYSDISFNLILDVQPTQQNFNISINEASYDGSFFKLLVNPSKKFNIILTNIMETPSYINYGVINSSSLNKDNQLVNVDTSGNITPLNSGFCYIVVEVGASTNYATTMKKVKLNISKNPQTPIVLSNVDALFFSKTANLTLSGGLSSNNYVLTSLSPNCSVNGLIITGNNAGICDFSVTKSGDFMYEDITSSISGIIVKKIIQPKLTLSILNQSPTGSDGSYIFLVDVYKEYTLFCSGYLENPSIIYSIETQIPYVIAPVCKITDNILSIYNSGEVFIKAITSDTINYFSSESNIIHIIFQKKSQNPFLFSTISSINYNQKINLSISGGSTTNSIIITKITNNCQIVNKSLFALMAGACQFNIHKDGNNIYNDLDQIVSLTINKIPQPFVFLQLNEINSNENENVYSLLINKQTEYTLILTDSNGTALSDFIITNSIDTPTITYTFTNLSSLDASGNPLCILNKDKLILLRQGKIKISAKISATTNYLDGLANDIIININKNVQNNLIINYKPTIKFKETMILSYTGGSVPENIVTYSVNNTSCNLTNNTEITGNSIGTCSVTATLQGNSTYLPISLTFTITVVKIPQTVYILDIATDNHIYVENVPYDLLLNNLQELTPDQINFSISGKIPKDPKYPDVCSLKGYKILPLSAGTCTIFATTIESTSYLATKTVPITIKITRKQALDFLIDPYNPLYYNSSIKITTDKGQYNKQIVFSYNGPEVTIDPNTNTFYGNVAGSYIITATKLGTSTYDPLVKTFTLIVNKIQQPNFSILNQNSSVFIGSINDIIISNTNEDSIVIFSVTEQKGAGNNNVCTIYDNKFEGLNQGTCKIIAKCSETTNYLPATSEPFIVTINKLNQNNLIVQKPDNLFLNLKASINVSGSNSSNNYVFSSLTSNVTINNNVITPIAAGNCIIRVSSPGDYKYNEIHVDIPYFVLPIKQPNVTIKNDDNIIYLNSTCNLNTINVLDNALVTYSITDIAGALSNICSISGNVLTPFSDGVCIIQAITSATDNYLQSKSNQLVINIWKVEQILVCNLVNQINYGTTVNFTVTGGKTSGSYNFLDIDSICTITALNSNNFKLTPLISGTFNLRITKDGDNIYNMGIIDIQFTVKQISQPSFNIENFPSNNTFNVDTIKSYPIIINNLMEEPSLIFNIIKLNPLDPNIISINGNSLIAINEGVCNLTVTTTQTTNYLSSTSSNNLLINVTKKEQAPLIFNLPRSIDYGSFIQLNITGGSTVNPFKYNLSNNNCKILVNALISNSAGTCDLQIIKNGDDVYKTISSTVSITVNKINQPNFKIYDINTINTIDVNPNSSVQLFLSPTYETSIINFVITSSVSFDTSNNICSFNGTTLIPKNAGTVTFKAYTDETTNYYKTFSPEIRVTIIKKNQADLVANINPIINYLDSYFISGTGGNTNNPLQYNTDSSCCFINGNSIKGFYAGTAKITVIKPGNYMYRDIIKNYSVTIKKIYQQDITINNINHLNEITVDNSATHPLILNNINENPLITFTISGMIPTVKNNTVVRITNNILVPLNAGTCTIYATTSETNNYLSTVTPVYNLIIKRKTPADFKIDNFPTIYVGSKYIITTDGGQSDLTIILSTTENGISIDGHTLTCLRAGQYVITATKKANFMYDELSKTFIINVQKLNQPNFNIINISQVNTQQKYLKKINFTEKFYYLSDIFSGNLANRYNNTELRYVGKNSNKVDSFVVNIGTVLYWTNSYGTGFNSFNIKSLINVE